MSTVATKNETMFSEFGDSVRATLDKMSKDEMYIVDCDKDELYQAYQDAYPEGTNEIYRERREHDCSCCKQFIRNMGRLVCIKNNKLVSVWDNTDIGFPYNEVAKKMSEYVKSKGIKRIFRSEESQYSTPTSLEPTDDGVRKWHHFSGKVAPKHRLTTGIGEFNSRITAAYDVGRRGLEEISESALQILLDLINDEAIYRGEEYKHSVSEFRNLQNRYKKSRNKEWFLWKNVDKGVMRFRNTVIGTIAVDLTEGVPVDEAVFKFENKMDPTKFKRPRSVITQKMVEDALKTVDDLNLRDAVDRRHAKITDVSVADVLFADSSVAPVMKDSLAELLETEVAEKPVNLDKAKTISIDYFLSEVVPESTSVSALVENRHMSNFMSITAPEGDADSLFKWKSNFAWSYSGDVTDSIKQRVKKAGGNVTAKYRVSLSWFNKDDLDIHVIEPTGNHVSYANKSGVLDVDMNAGTIVRDPVENLCWNKLKDGQYKVFINNFTRRENIDVGFVVETEFEGDVKTYSYQKPVTRDVIALTMEVKNGKITKVVAGKEMSEESSSKENWGVKTQTLTPIDTVMLSPNYWNDDSTGNQHWFFILRDCLNPDPVRGFYNEFLNEGLTKHRKVLEILGEKKKCDYSDEQLSGIGFSSTKRDNLKVVATSGDGSSTAYNIKF